MDNVQNCVSYINIPSSQTYTSYFSHVAHFSIRYIHLSHPLYIPFPFSLQQALKCSIHYDVSLQIV
jgi:hypothetical protein